MGDCLSISFRGLNQLTKVSVPPEKREEDRQLVMEVKVIAGLSFGMDRLWPVQPVWVCPWYAGTIEENSRDLGLGGQALSCSMACKTGGGQGGHKAFAVVNEMNKLPHTRVGGGRRGKTHFTKM